MSNDQPQIDPEMVEQMNELARFLDCYFNGEKTGDEREIVFALLAWRVGNKGRGGYASNAPRPAMLTALKTFVAAAEGRVVQHQTRQ